MTNKDLTEMVFILDRSGSMSPVIDESIEGFNSMVEKQKLEPGRANVSLAIFDNEYNLIYDGENINNIDKLNNSTFFARGLTALLDAVGKTINTVGQRLSSINEEYRPSKVIVAIMTDGLENSSREFSRDKIKEMVETQTDKFKWEFIFLGANMDAIGEGNAIGVKRSFNYSGGVGGQSVATQGLSDAVASYRSTGSSALDELSQDSFVDNK